MGRLPDKATISDQTALDNYVGLSLVLAAMWVGVASPPTSKTRSLVLFVPADGKQIAEARRLEVELRLLRKELTVLTVPMPAEGIDAATAAARAEQAVDEAQVGRLVGAVWLDPTASTRVELTLVVIAEGNLLVQAITGQPSPRNAAILALAVLEVLDARGLFDIPALGLPPAPEPEPEPTVEASLPAPRTTPWELNAAAGPIGGLSGAARAFGGWGLDTSVWRHLAPWRVGATLGVGVTPPAARTRPRAEGVTASLGLGGWYTWRVGAAEVGPLVQARATWLRLKLKDDALATADYDLLSLRLSAGAALVWWLTPELGGMALLDAGARVPQHVVRRRSDEAALFAAPWVDWQGLVGVVWLLDDGV